MTYYSWLTVIFIAVCVIMLVVEAIVIIKRNRK